MRKIKYYAPYWVSAIVVIAIVLLIIIKRFGTRTEDGFSVYTPFSELPELAATLENDNYFISENGTILKRVGGTRVSVRLATSEEHPSKIVGSFKPKPLSEMRPHEYAAYIYDRPIFVRQDGSVYANRSSTTMRVCPPSELPDSAVEAEMQISADETSGSIFELRHSDEAFVDVVFPTTDVEGDFKWQLSAKLKDGWYIISNDYFASKKAYADDKVNYNFEVTFPALRVGDYRLEVNIGDEWFYQEMSLTEKGFDTGTIRDVYTLTCD